MHPSVVLTVRIVSRTTEAIIDIRSPTAALRWEPIIATNAGEHFR